MPPVCGRDDQGIDIRGRKLLIGRNNNLAPLVKRLYDPLGATARGELERKGILLLLEPESSCNVAHSAPSEPLFVYREGKVRFLVCNDLHRVVAAEPQRIFDLEGIENIPLEVKFASLGKGAPVKAHFEARELRSKAVGLFVEVNDCTDAQSDKEKP